MLKITPIVDSTHRSIGLRLEGKLLEPWLAELRAAFDELEEPSPDLDLGSVGFVDAASARCLQDWISAGARVTACSSFVAKLLHGAAR